MHHDLTLNAKPTNMKRKYNPDAVIRDCKGNPIRRLGPKRDLNREFAAMQFTKDADYRYNRKLRPLTAKEKKELEVQRQRVALAREVEANKALASQSMLQAVSFSKQSAILADRNETR